MNDFEFDNQIKKALNDCVDHLETPDSLKERIDFMITKPNKTISWRKVCVGIVAVACVATVGAFARGQVTGLSTGTDLTKSITSIQVLNDKADKISDKISLPEKLGDNKFKDGSIGSVDKLDNDMNKIGNFPEVYAGYGDVYVNIHQYDAEVDIDAPVQKGQTAETKEIDNINVCYQSEKYLFVPADYKLTDAEKQMQENNEIIVSYGSDEKEEQIFQNVSWQKDGLYYMISTYSDCTPEQLFDYASQLISQ